MNVTIDGEEYTDLTEDQQRHASAIARLQEHLALLDEQRENAMISLRHRESELARSLKE
jgi:predicted metalloenzyme YecM